MFLHLIEESFEMKPEVKVSEAAIREQNIRVAVTRADFMTRMPRFYKAFDYVDMYSTSDSRVETLCVAPEYDSTTKELTGYHDLMWNPTFTAQLSDQQLIGVQEHELLHIILGHTTKRRPEYKSMSINSKGQAEIKDKEDQVMNELWNIACDLAINCMIEGDLFDPKGLKDVGLFPGEKQFAQFPKNRTAEFYFEELYKQHKQNMKDLDALLKDLKKQFAEGKIGSHGEWVEADGKTRKVTKESGKAAARKGAGEAKTSGADKDAPTADEIAKEIEDISEEMGLGQQAGTSGGTTKYTDLSKGKELKVPGWMKKTTHASVHGFEVSPVATRKVPNRRYGILFPGKKRVAHRNSCAVFVDVSGSIDRPKLVKFTEHLNKLKKYADFDLTFFNHSLIDVNGREHSPSEGEKCRCKWKTGMNFYVGGGTDFEPIMLYWNRVRSKYDAMFIFTDGEASYQTAPLRPREVNWILYASSNWYIEAIKHGNKYNINEKAEK
jgi:predicted metal-dependent peptidase